MPGRALLLPAALLLLGATEPHPAIFTDPPADVTHPARAQVLHIPTGGVKVNGLAYIAAGPGPHPVLVLLHGLPGNEKNLDLAQAVRRVGWTVVTFNYRGSWGSPGAFRFAQNPEDARAAIAYVRAHAVELGVDPRRIVLGGHSMGGWATVMAAAREPGLAGAILISAANMGIATRGKTRDEAIAFMEDNREALSDSSAAQMADELAAAGAAFDFDRAAPAALPMPMLVLTSDDGLAPQVVGLVGRQRAAGGLTAVHVATDHGWSGDRIRLADEVIRWLQALPRP